MLFGSTGVADKASSSPQYPVANEASAWDFYSRSSEAQTRYSQGDNNEPRSIYSKEDFYQPDDPYFGGLSELGGTQLNRTTWSQEPTAPTESNGTTWPQYALAILVIALLIVLAVITLILYSARGAALSLPSSAILLSMISPL